MPEELTFNEEYRVTARKWRPRIFSEVSSQEFITQTLKNSVKNNRISHAYLFSGPRGVGKTTVARILAKSLNCSNRKPDGDPCNECDSCREIDNDNRNHPDVFEIDGASNRNIEDVRELKEKVKYGPIRSKYKIFIIDEVHMLTGASFNALLKTLEEPPGYIVFIFATTAPEKVPLTILGRCQKFDFKRLTIDEIITRLSFIAEKENVKIDEESLFFMAKKGDGSMRDAQGLFDMSSAYTDNNITFDKLKQFFNLAESDVYFNISDLIKAKNGEGLLKYFDDLMNRGYDMQTFLDGLTEHYRNLLIVTSTGSADLIIESESVKQRYKECTGKYLQLEIINSLKLILQTEYTFKYSSNQRTLIEALLVELIKFTDTRDISEIVEELKELKTGLKKKFSTEESTLDSKLSAQKEPVPEVAANKAVIEPRAPGGNGISSRDNTGLQGRELSPPISQTQPPGSELLSHWKTIVDSIGSEKKWVYSMLKDSEIEQTGKNTYLLRVDEGRLEFLNTYKEYLVNKVTDHFGSGTGLELASKIAQQLNKPEVSNPDAQKANDIPARRSTNGGEPADNFERICSILQNEFNARELNQEDASRTHNPPF